MRANKYFSFWSFQKLLPVGKQPFLLFTNASIFREVYREKNVVFFSINLPKKILIAGESALCG